MPCCHGSKCNIALRVISLILGILAFCIHCAAAGHTYWMCFDKLCTSRMSLFNRIRSIWLIATYHPLGDYLDGAYIKACQAFAFLAVGSSFMAFIFMCVRFCIVKKPVEYLTLFFLFGAYGCEFLVWVIFVAVRAKDIEGDVRLGDGFGCSVCSMVFSFLCFAMISASVKRTGPIVKKPKAVVVVNAQPTQVMPAGQQVVVMGGQPSYQPPAYDDNKPPLY